MTADPKVQPVQRIAVLMACHNRRDKTLACLVTTIKQASPTAALEVFLTDDGSTDGTVPAVKRAFPEVHLSQGDGTLFWAAGMALAERRAVRTDPDFLLWLNDDTLLDPDAMETLLAASRRHPGAIIVGAMRDPVTGAVAYGGRMRAGRHPLKFRTAGISSDDQVVSSFNGNCVLVPREVRRAVGPIDGLYAHAYADDDYAFRARARGIACVQAAGSVGNCSRHDEDMQRRSLTAAWRLMNSPKGMPLASQVRFLRRHGGPGWPVLLATTRVGYLLRSMDLR